MGPSAHREAPSLAAAPAAADVDASAAPQAACPATGFDSGPDSDAVSPFGEENVAEDPELRKAP
eukprot:2148489-Pyramimonas_sp.AAC.1